MCCCDCMSDLCLVILSIFFPPLPVWIRRGVCSADSWINILLCILGYFPGLIHSWYIIAKYPPCSGNHDSKIYYVYQSASDLESQRHSEHHHSHSHSHNHSHNHGGNVTNQPLAHSGPSYGATGNTNGCHNNAHEGSSANAPPAYTELPSTK